MEELLELRGYVEQQRYDDALNLIGEMEEMSREDKVNKIGSFVKILLIHLIKRHAEKRTTRSWDNSIFNAIFEIQKTNKRKKSGGFYMNRDEINQTLREHYSIALRYAATEAFEGRYEDDELAQMIDQSLIVEQALKLILEE
jgi:pentatricopeptide repeat protein